MESSKKSSSHHSSHKSHHHHHRDNKMMPPSSSVSPSLVSAEANDLFEHFMSATTLKGVLSTFRKICSLLDLSPGPFNSFYPAFKRGLSGSHHATKHHSGGPKNWKAQSIFSKIDKKASNRVYHNPIQQQELREHCGCSSSSNGCSNGSASVNNHCTTNNILSSHNCLVIGGGPCGLRTAIELQLIGSQRVVVVEKRDRFSRNNVLHLWPFVISDLKLMAGKKFYGKFCAGSIDHVSIRQLQLMLLKFALILGVEFVDNVTFEEICPKNVVPSLSPKSGVNLRKAFNGNGKLSPLAEIPDGNSSSRKTNGDNGINSSTSPSSPSSTSSPVDDYQMMREKLLGSSSSGNSTSSPTNSRGNNRLAGTTESNSASCTCCCHLHHHSASTSNSSSSCQHHHLPGAYAHFSITSNGIFTNGGRSPITPTTSMTPTTPFDFPSLLSRLHSTPFHVILGADGRRNTLADYFPRKEFRGRLAIAITANFVNTHTLLEAQIPEISGISFIYNQQLFRTLYSEMGIDLENICYYKDDTHYFVMTAKKGSLLERGVLRQDHADTRALLSPENINRVQLLAYARDAAKWTTGLEQEFALNHYGEPDVAMFDFTSMYAAENACRAKKIVPCCCIGHNGKSDSGNLSGCCDCRSHDCAFHQNNKKMRKEDDISKKYHPLAPVSEDSDRTRSSQLRGMEWKESLMRLSTTTASSLDIENGSFILLGLVGDSLLEPFWPTGSGCARGFLSAMDSAWMVRQWVMKGCPWNEEEALQVLKEREQIYRLLGQTKSENLSQNYSSYTLNPLTRYPNLNSSTAASTAMTGFNECRHLLYDDVHPPMPGSHMSNEIKKQSLAAKRARRATIASILPFEQGRKSESPESLKETSEERDPSPISLSKSRTSPIGDLSSSMSSSRLRRSKTVKVEPLKAVSVEYSNGGNKRRKEEKSLLHQVLTSSLSSSMSSSTHESSSVRQQREDPSRVDQSFEDSLADFESNYQGLLSSPTPSNLSHSSSATVVNSSRSSDRTGDKCRSSAFNDLMLSPSASNLATIGRSRAKDIESALRHRRAQQSVYERPSSLSISESSHGYQKSSTISNMPSMREKVSSLIESGNTANNDRGFENQLSQSSGKDGWAGGPSFHNKVKTLEQKLAAASGIPLDRFGQVTRPELIDEEEQRRTIKSGGSHVLEAASTLEQLLDPQHQEEKLKEKAKDYHKKTSDIKVVMKMTRDTDWNKKCWEEREKKAQETNNPPPKVSPTPRPKKLLDVFQDKKEEITSKLRDSPSRDEGDKLGIRTLSSTKKPRSRKGPGGDETDWISLLKGELSERSTNHVIAKTAVVKPPLRSPFGETAEEKKSRGAKFDFVPSRRNSKGDVKNLDNGRNGIQMDYEKPLFTGTTTGSSTGMSSRCARCAEKVALVDRVVMSGVVIHRSCLTCSRCGVSLRLSEVRNGWLTNGQWGDKPTINSSHFICSLCQKNSSTVLTSVSSSDVVSSRPPRSPNSPRKGSLTTSSSGHMVSGSNSSNSSSHPTDEYELKIKERMKWKEQYLSDNNGLDFTPLVKRDLENSKSGLLRTSSTSSISQTTTSPSEGTLNGQSTKLSSNLSPLKEELPSPGSNPPVLERIEYENTSKSRELFDDDELSRMLNLSTNFEDEDDDQEDEEEDTSNSTEETSGSTSASWKKSQDSTDADFDSDEAFDANSHRSPKISNKSTPLEEKSIPDIIVETSEEVHLIDDHEDNLREVATTDEISTHVLDGSTVATPTLSFSQSVTLASEEEDDDSLTLHEDNMVVRRKSSKKKNINQRKPALDSVSRQDTQEGDRTSLSSLSCCDTTFDDVNLVSLITDEETKNGQKVVSGKSGQSTSKDNHVSSMSISTTTTKSSTNTPLLASNNYSSNSHIGSNNSNFSIYSPLLTSSLLTSLSNSRNSNPSSMSTNSSEKTLVASSSSTTISNSTNSMIRHSTPSKFKVAQPKFTVFNFDQPAVTPSNNGQQQHSQTPWHVSSRVNNLPTILTKTSPSTSLLLNDINRRSSTGSSTFLINRNQLLTNHPITPPAIEKEGIADGEGKPVAITPSSDGETYSKIPILLSARVSDVQPAMSSTMSTSLTQGQPQSKPLTTLKAVPSYSGSFTEKLLQRCRSTPSVPGETGVGTVLGKENKSDSPQAILAKWACSNLIVQPPRSVRTPASTTLLLSRGTTNGSGGAAISAPAKTSASPVTTIRSSLVKPTIGSSYCSSLNSTNLTTTTSRHKQSPLATATPISTRR